MAETPYCPLLSIGKEVPVLCQEELCMWYVKQLKLCSLTVMAYSGALNLQGPQGNTQQTPKPSAPQKTSQQSTPKPTPKPQQQGGINPFALDDLD